MDGAPMGQQMPPQMHHDQMPPQDNGIPPMSGGPHPVTSLITTGPDGAPLDEASQQSTISNTSIG
jgi:AT-rich interactive domain-containing protein 1